ncbi:MAG: YceI family protein [Terriglobales bacterium]
MRKKIWIAILFLALPMLALADSQWSLTSSALTYSVSHPFHHVEGVSHDAKGKGECQGRNCELLIAAPVKSFDSGDSNRDLHMLQATRGGQYPMVVVRTEFPESEIHSGTIHADLEVQFAGQTVHYKQVLFQLTVQGNQAHLSGTVPATLTDFKIVPPSLLTIPIKNEIPVQVEMTWQKM